MDDLVIRLFVMNCAVLKLSEKMRHEFQNEQQCSIGFAGLRPVWRVFV